jgi:hypothetical protein
VSGKHFPITDSLSRQQNLLSVHLQEMSQNRIRSLIRTKRWCKGLVFLKKPYYRKNHFSTASQLAIPNDDTIVAKVIVQTVSEVPKLISTETVNPFPIDLEKVPTQSPDESATHTTYLKIVDPSSYEKWPMYSVLDRFGKFLPGALASSIEKEKMVEMYTVMSRVQTLDDIFYNAQRQGRISFYMQSSGEEATQIGVTA